MANSCYSFYSHDSKLSFDFIKNLISCINQTSLISFQANIGIIKENPSTIAGTIQIMERLQDYVPWFANDIEKPHIIPCHGDGLSIERMTDAKRARAANPTKKLRLEGLEQVPQEFHHRGIILQVLV